MNTKLFIYLFPLIMITGGGCANKKTLVQDLVTVQYAGANQEKVWKGVEAKKKIPLKSLNVLVIDGTDTQVESPFKEPLRIYSDDSISIDSLIESKYYNQLVLKAFRESLPRKANIRMLTEELSGKAIDSLIRVNKFDLVITAQQIRFDYQFRFAGMGHFDNFIKSGRPRNYLGSRHTAGHIDAIKGGIAFQLSDVRSMPPILMRTIIYHTRWHLQWIDSTLNKKDTTPQQLDQEGFLTDGGNNDTETLLFTISQEAGKNMAEVFKW